MCILLSVCTFGKRVFILVRGQATDRLYAFLLLFYNCNQPTLFCFSFVLLLFFTNLSRFYPLPPCFFLSQRVFVSRYLPYSSRFYFFLLFIINLSHLFLFLPSNSTLSLIPPFLSSSICNESLSHLLNRTTTRLHHRSVSTFHRQSNLYVGLFEGWLRTTPPQTRFQPPSSLIPSIYESRNAWRRDILSLSFSIRKT